MASFTERVPRVLVPFGLTVLVLTFVLSLWQAALVSDVYNTSEAERQAAPPGSTLGTDMRRAEALAGWLTPLRFVGLGALLSGILMMFAGVLQAIKFNADAMPELFRSLPSPAPIRAVGR